MTIFKAYANIRLFIMKTKNIIHTYITRNCRRMLSVIMVFAVMLVATHAKDIVAQPTIRPIKFPLSNTQLASRSQDDPMQKSVGDLHNHTDKTMLKNFAKSMGDASSLAARRDDHDEPSGDRSLSRRLFEVYMMLQFAYASATS